MMLPAGGQVYTGRRYRRSVAALPRFCGLLPLRNAKITGFSRRFRASENSQRMIVTNSLTIQFGAKPLFENVSVKFGDGNRYGLIGANGSGKSTFMKILGGDLESSSGSVATDANERVGKLRQDQFAYEDVNVIDVVIMGHERLWAVKQERDAIYARAEMSEEDGHRVADLEAEFAELDGYTAESRAGELLLGVGIPIEQHFGPMSAVAPGWKLRVLLVQVLFADPDIMLLDEPTNNLDINAIRWLEGVLDARDATMIIISHDRHFLNSICTHTADLDYGSLTVYPGSYDEYMEASTQARAQLLSQNAKTKDRIAELQDFVRRFSANKSKARQATSRKRLIEKLKVDEVKPSSRQYPFIRFEVDERQKLHRLAVEVESLTRGYPGMPKPLVKDLSMMVEAGEKVAIIGQNGIGKTTLLRLLAGDLAPDRGKVKWAEKANLGYFAQDHGEVFASDRILYDWMEDWRQPGDDEQKIRGTLGRLLFSSDDTRKKLKVISGGEQVRMLLGKLMLEKPNVLLMDEPTNHLDMESIEALNDALDRYTGTLFFVSHDRAFVSSIATRIIEMTPQGLTDFRGNYDDYLLSLGIAA
jgi:ATPase subunit of ABC transporter with duplicated ATPase domains